MDLTEAAPSGTASFLFSEYLARCGEKFGIPHIKIVFVMLTKKY
jgi:hypothetical protein